MWLQIAINEIPRASPSLIVATKNAKGLVRPMFGLSLNPPQDIWLKKMII